MTNYNLACMYARKKDADAAFFYLNRAADGGGFMGQNLKNQIKADTDFDNIRDDSRYEAMLKTADQKTAKYAAGGQDEGPAAKAVEPAWKVTLPMNYDASRKAPLVVALHHYHGNMSAATERWRKAADSIGAILLTPQGTVQLSDGMYHWGDNLDTVERNVMAAIDRVMDEYKIDESKIVLGGFSQGARAAWCLGARNPDTFRGLIPVCGGLHADDAKRLESPECKALRVWIMLGEDENSGVVEANEAAAEKLRKAGAEVTVKSYEGVGHGFPENSDEELTKALRFILG